MVLMSDYRDHNDFSCINICRVPRKLFEYEAPRPNTFKLPPRDPANVFPIYYFIISTDIHEAKLIEDSIQFRKQH